MDKVSETQARPWDHWAIMLAALIVGLLGWHAMYPTASQLLPDNRLVLNAYAAQLRAGHGLVFNPGERVLLIPSPAYMLALALTGPEWLFALALALGTGCLFRTARRMKLSPAGGLLVAGVYLLTWPLWSGIGTAFPLMTAFCLLALEMALAGRWPIAGLVFALASLCSPEALIPALVILFFAVEQGSGPQYALPLFGALGAALLALVAFYGPSLWQGLLILKHSAEYWFDVLSWPFLILLLLVAIWVWYRKRTDPVVALCGAWIVLYLFVVGALLRTSAGWQYLPIVGPAALLTGLLFERYPITSLIGVFGVVFVGLIAFALATENSAQGMLASVDVLPVTLSRQLDEMAHSIPPDQAYSIGVWTKQDGLLLDRSADHKIIALDGQFQPELKQVLERGDKRSILIRYAPDFLPSAQDSAQAELLNPDLLALLGYQKVGETRFYQRSKPLGQFVSQPADVPYGPDIRLTGLALDKQTASGLLRVRLDWQLERPASKPVTIELRLTGGTGDISAARDDVTPGVLLAGASSTYHALRIPTDGTAGQATLQIGLIISNGLVARAPVAQIALR
jgi:hypothetical protein